MQKPGILILTYYWPPSGGPATQRWLDYSGYLSKAGYRVFVLAPDADKATYPAIDPSLEAQIDPSVTVIRTPTRELFWLYKRTVGKGTIPSGAFVNDAQPGLLQKIARFIRGNFFLPDPRKGWNKFSIPVARQIIEQQKMDFVITAGPPHSTHLAGMALQKATGVKWIADFHDAWTDIIFYHQLYKTAATRNKDRAMERLVLSRADAVLAVGEQLAAALAMRVSLERKQSFHVLRMGYRDGLFSSSLNKQKLAGQLKIAYTGTMAASYHPEVLFRVMRKMDQQGMPVQLTVAGLWSDDLMQCLDTFQIRHLVTIRGYLPHHEVIDVLSNADMLLLAGVQVPQEAMIIPGKIYEYLATGKPILNITLPEAETAEIIAITQSGKTFGREEDVALMAWLTEWYNGSGSTFHPTGSSAYSRSEQANGLVAFLKSLHLN